MSLWERFRRWLRIKTCRHEWEQSCTWMRGCERPIHHRGLKGIAPLDGIRLGTLLYYCRRCDSDGERWTGDPLDAVEVVHYTPHPLHATEVA